MLAFRQLKDSILISNLGLKFVGQYFKIFSLCFRIIVLGWVSIFLVWYATLQSILNLLVWFKSFGSKFQFGHESLVFF